MVIDSSERFIRKREMSPQAAARVKEFNEEQRDWYATCPVCGARLRGSLGELTKHECWNGEAD